MITDEDKERVRQATDILQLVGETVELRRRGADFWGCCPFHHEKSPSFHVNPSTGLWKCFGCGEGGDLFAYVMKRESLDFPDSIRYLADRAGIELSEERTAGPSGPKRNRLIDCLAAAEGFYSTLLMRGRGEGPAAGRAYLAGRGFGSTVCRRWGLGYAPGHGQLVSHLRSKGFSPQEMLACDLALDGRGGPRDRFFDRVMFPIHDEQGRTIGFGGRVLTDAKPKYLNTKETRVFHKGKHLFAFHRAKEAMVASGEAIVCEGYTDVIAMHEAGITNAVAALGTALTLDHVRMIERFAKSRVVCMFDGDEAGQRAAERAIQYIDKTSVELRCVVLPGGQDPAEYLGAHGADELRARIAESRPLMDFVFEKRLAGVDLSVPGRRVAALDQMAALLAPLDGSILLDGYATQLADLLGTSVDETKRHVHRQAQRKRNQDAGGAGTRVPTTAGAAPSPAGGYLPAAEAYAGYDGPSEAGAPIALAALSSDERMQATAERELLSLMAKDIEAIRPDADRIASFSWVDARHESMAWAMLATPEGATPAEVVAAASSMVADAPRLLAGGRLQLVSGMSASDQASFLLDVVELWSCRRAVRSMKARLRSASSLPDESSQELFRRATDVQKRIGELGRRISSLVSS
nr:DNA primase [uncultured Olsenella sp.]